MRMPLRRVPASLQLGLRVREAAAWEALVESHRSQAAEFARVLGTVLPADAALASYFRFVAVPAKIRDCVETGALLRLDLNQVPSVPAPDGWLASLRHRVRMQQEAERMAPLAAARAEQALIRVHVDNALAIEAYLREVMPSAEAIAWYLRTFGLAAGAANVVYQEALAQVAERELPDPTAEAAFQMAMLPSGAPEVETPDGAATPAVRFLRLWSRQEVSRAG
jgi:hypothetical protein